MREYAAGVSSQAGLVAPKLQSVINVARQPVEPSAIDERGITDLVMSTLWWFGPSRMTHVSSLAVSQSGESKATGADIAFVDVANHRILVYQSKVATLDATQAQFELKSGVKKHHVPLLRQRKIQLEGHNYDFEGRLALYVVDDPGTPLVGVSARWFWEFELFEFMGRLAEMAPNNRYTNDSRLGQRYYERVLHRNRWSPRAILAAPIGSLDSSRLRITSGVPWPWECDFFAWASGQTITGAGIGGAVDFVDDLFPPYSSGNVDPPSEEQIGGIADQLMKTRLFTNRTVHVIAFRGSAQ